MKQLLKTSVASVAGFFALAFVATATPAAAYEYCRRDITSYMLGCSFDTMAQCQAMSSGRGGDCLRDPFLAPTPSSSAYAYQPNRLHSKRSVHSAK
jgi:hypothetical protein